jgi:hypothetical protein
MVEKSSINTEKLKPSTAKHLDLTRKSPYAENPENVADPRECARCSRRKLNSLLFHFLDCARIFLYNRIVETHYACIVPS